MKTLRIILGIYGRAVDRERRTWQRINAQIEARRKKGAA